MVSFSSTYSSREQQKSPGKPQKLFTELTIVRLRLSAANTLAAHQLLLASSHLLLIHVSSSWQDKVGYLHISLEHYYGKPGLNTPPPPCCPVIRQ